MGLHPGLLRLRRLLVGRTQVLGGVLRQQQQRRQHDHGGGAATQLLAAPATMSSFSSRAGDQRSRSGGGNRGRQRPRPGWVSSSSSAEAAGSAGGDESVGEKLLREWFAFGDMRQLDEGLKHLRESGPARQHDVLVEWMRRCWDQGCDLQLLLFFRELCWAKQARAHNANSSANSGNGSGSSSKQMVPIQPEEAAIALVAAQRLGRPNMLQRAVEGFLGSYERHGTGSVEERAGPGWWRPIVEALEASFPSHKGWRAQWALLQEARRRGLCVDDGDDQDAGGLRLNVLRALQAATLAFGEEGRTAKALLLLEEEGAEGVGEGMGDAVLSLIRSGGLLSEAWALLGRGKDASWAGPCYLELLQALIKERDRGQATAVWTEMRDQGHTLPPSDAADIAHALLLLAVGEGRADWSNGLSLLSALPTQFGVVPSVDDYAAVLQSLANGGRGQEAYELIQRMTKEGGVAPDVRCLNHALRACGRMQMPKEARELMGLVAAAQKESLSSSLHHRSWPEDEEMGEEGDGERAAERRSAFTYSLAIDAAAKAGDADRAVALLGEMKDRGLPPLAGCYGPAMNALGKAGRVDEVMALLGEMKASPSLQPDAVIYTIAIDACARAHDAVAAIALLHEMQHAQGLPPNPISYSAAINACAKARYGRRALALVREMEEKGLPLNHVAYGTAIQALNLSEEDDAALLALFDEMRAKGLQAAPSLYGAAIKACDRSLDFARALEIGEAMLEAGHTPLPRAITCVLRGADRAMLHERGLAFLRAALAKGAEPPGQRGVKIAFNVAAKLGDTPSLLACLRLAREADAVDPWMLQLAVAAVNKAGRTLAELCDQDEAVLGQLRRLVLELKQEAAARRRDGSRRRDAVGEGAEGGSGARGRSPGDRGRLGVWDRSRASSAPPSSSPQGRKGREK